MSPRPQERSIRIIGGNWRGRKISFAKRDPIRPTPARIRETIFSWLQADIAGASTLELFGGSGVLSFEALSRGAARADVVELDRAIARQISEEQARLNASRLNVHSADAMAWLADNASTWDIAFLDPPFGADLVEPLRLLIARVRAGGFVYVESPAALEPDALPAGYLLHRQKRAARVHFALLKRV